MIQEDTVVGGRYHLLRLVGQGGMAEVWEAEDATLERRVAVKLLRSGDPELAARLQREAHALATLDHPNLVRLLDAGSESGRPYVVMDLVGGPSLADALDRLGFPSEQQAAAMGAEVAAGLAYVHRAGIVHRDVKPSNVLLDAPGASAGYPPAATARLADFGVAQLGDASALTSTGLTVGTAAYMAPEQLEGSRVGPAADVWALGMVLLECLTGRRVYQGTPVEVVARRLSGPVPLPPTLPSGWHGLLSSMLDHDPARRPDAAAVAAALGGGPPAAAAPTAVIPAGRTSRLPATEVLAAAPLAAAPLAAAPLAGAQLGAAPLGAAPLVGPARQRRRGPLLAAALGCLVVLVALVAALASRPAPGRTSAAGSTASSSTTQGAPATTAAAPTTAAPPGAALFSRLAGDVATAVSTGELPHDVAQQVLQHAQAALQPTGGAPSQLQAALTALDTAAYAGRTDAATTTTVSNDLAALAAALGVPAPTPPAPPAPSPGHGKHGGGDEGGDGG